MKSKFSEMQKLAIAMMGIHGEITPRQLKHEWVKLKDINRGSASRRQFGLNSASHQCLYKLEAKGICCMHKPDGFTLVFQLIPGAGGSEVEAIVKSAIENIKVTHVDQNDGMAITFDTGGNDQSITTVHMSKNNVFIGVNANEAIKALEGFSQALNKFSVSAATLTIRLPGELRQRIVARRRYYLHRKIKKFCKVKARQKTVFITQPVHDALTESQMKDITELIRGGYSVQIEIPN